MRIEPLSGITEAIARRHQELGSVLAKASHEELIAPSLLPGWTRLTIVCHLRFGAETNLQMTIETLDGRHAAFYPLGRPRQRPATLVPRPGEGPADVVASLSEASSRLDDVWGSLSAEQWQLPVREPEDNPDLGPTTLGMLSMLRLTEIEVHGLDLDLGALPWSNTFVDAALPMRIGWLPTRRSNHSDVDGSVVGTWVLKSNDGTSYAIHSTPDGVSVEAETLANGDATIAGSKADLLGWLLGRLDISELSVTGDRDLAESFHRAFPAP